LANLHRLIPWKRKSGAVASLSGSLEDFRLSAPLVLLELEHKSGLLMVTHARTGSCGTVFVRQGRVVRAAIEGRSDRQNSEAVIEMLSWNRGTFEFLPAAVDLADEVGSSTTTILLEAARRQDEAEIPPK